ncbi:MAG: type II secretion system F family protein [Alcaligenaceae bacterium]|nr:type II secretion system F family protein [Alcaligenaceae bacterium]
MVLISLLFATISIALICWLVLQGFNQAASRYESELKEQMRVQLSDAFIFFDPMQLWSLAVASTTLVFFISWLLFKLWWLSLFLALIVFFMPKLLLRILRKRRLQTFDRQLPDFLLALAGALQAGSGVQTAIQSLAEDAQSPLAQELSLVLREQRLGVSFDQCLQNLSLRMPSEACELFVSSLRISAQTGGNLSEAIERIASTLRSRLQIQARIKALTSQGKMQAVVMCLLPLALMLILNRLDPEAMHHLWYSYMGWAVLGLIFFLEALGVWMISKIVAIDV